MTSIPNDKEKSKLSILFEPLDVVPATNLSSYKVEHPNIKAITTWLSRSDISEALEEVEYFSKVFFLIKKYKFNYGHISLGMDNWKRFLRMGFIPTTNFLLFLWQSGILIPVCTVKHAQRPYYQHNWVWRFSADVLKVTPDSIKQAGKTYPYSRSRKRYVARPT